MSLTVTDDAGATDTWSTTVTVEQPTTTTRPAAPTNVVAGVSGGAVTVSWGDVTGEDSYTVVRQKQHHRNGKWISESTAASLGADTTSFTDRPGDGKYRYRVTASNAAGSSTSSWTSAITVSTTTDGGSTDNNGKGNGRKK